MLTGKARHIGVLLWAVICHEMAIITCCRKQENGWVGRAKRGGGRPMPQQEKRNVPNAPHRDRVHCPDSPSNCTEKVVLAGAGLSEASVRKKRDESEETRSKILSWSSGGVPTTSETRNPQ